jgi:polyisoprenoid-binding protein YceI
MRPGREEDSMAEATSPDAAVRTERPRTFMGVEIPPPGEYVIDQAHTTVSFVARHMMVSKVRGYFREFSGSIHVAEDPLQSWAEIAIKAASVDTGTEMRDNHLRSRDFLISEENPELTFRTNRLEHLEGTNFRAYGDITIAGVARPLVLDVEFEGAVADMRGGTRIALSAKGEIDREEFGITWNQTLETGGVLVGRKVKLELEVAAVRASDQAA